MRETTVTRARIRRITNPLTAGTIPHKNNKMPSHYPRFDCPYQDFSSPRIDVDTTETHAAPLREPGRLTLSARILRYRFGR